MPRKAKSSPRQPSLPSTDAYRHKEAELLLRPEVGTQANFRKKKQPATYRYDSSLAPALDWDDQPARALGEWLLACEKEAVAWIRPAPQGPERQGHTSAWAFVNGVLPTNFAIMLPSAEDYPGLSLQSKSVCVAL